MKKRGKKSVSFKEKFMEKENPILQPTGNINLKYIGLSIFILGIAIFLLVPFSGITGMAISSKITESETFGLYLIGLSFMILGAVLTEYRPQRKPPRNYAAELLEQKRYSLSPNDLQAVAFRCGYELIGSPEDGRFRKGNRWVRISGKVRMSEKDAKETLEKLSQD